MRKILTILTACSSIFLFSCQKEVDFANGNGNGNGNGGGGNSNGELLVKALEVTPSTNDTNIITFEWDASKRLIKYHSIGRINGFDDEITDEITRLGDGKIQKIKTTTSLTAGLIDSVIYTVHYVPGSPKIAYHIATQYTFIGDLKDSVIYTYNSAGQVSSQVDFTDIFGIVQESSKETYVYDANGNVTTHNTYSPNGTGGYDLEGAHIYTYSTHKNAVVLGDEAYVAVGVDNVSANYASKTVIANTADPTQNLTINFLQSQYNSFDRPTSTTLNIVPQPPGYDLKLIYFYQ